MIIDRQHRHDHSLRIRIPAPDGKALYSVMTPGGEEIAHSVSRIEIEPITPSNALVLRATITFIGVAVDVETVSEAA